MHSHPLTKGVTGVREGPDPMTLKEGKSWDMWGA